MFTSLDRLSTDTYSRGWLQHRCDDTVTMSWLLCRWHKLCLHQLTPARYRAALGNGGRHLGLDRTRNSAFRSTDDDDRDNPTLEPSRNWMTRRVAIAIRNSPEEKSVGRQYIYLHWSNINKLTSLQRRVRATKSHIQNSTNYFTGTVWQNELIHVTWPYLTFCTVNKRSATTSLQQL